MSEPNSQAMLAQINNALISVVATASAETVTAIELLEQCIQNAFNVPGIQPCLLASNAPSPFLSISNVLAGVYVIQTRRIRIELMSFCSPASSNSSVTCPRTSSSTLRTVSRARAS